MLAGTGGAATACTAPGAISTEPGLDHPLQALPKITKTAGESLMGPAPRILPGWPTGYRRWPIGDQYSGAERAQHGAHVADRLAADQSFPPGAQVPVKVLAARRARVYGPAPQNPHHTVTTAGLVMTPATTPRTHRPGTLPHHRAAGPPLRPSDPARIRCPPAPSPSPKTPSSARSATSSTPASSDPTAPPSSRSRSPPPPPRPPKPTPASVPG